MEVDLIPLAGRARLFFHLQAGLRFLVLWVPMAIGASVALSFVLGFVVGSLAGAGILLAAFLFSVWWPSLVFDRWGYVLREHDLLIARGVLLRRITAIPLDRIQHVDTAQGLIEQSLGLARLQVHTASGIGIDGVVPGLDLEDAEALRDTLVAAAGGDDGV